MSDRRLRVIAGALALAAGCVALPALAQVPPDVEAKLVAIGRVVDAPGTAAIYYPIQKDQSYKGVTLDRDKAYGPNERQKLDVATSTTKSAKPKPVLIYIPGGVGNKKLDYPGGEPFYDNIMIMAVNSGMVGVNMERRSGGGLAWDAGAQDVSGAVEWVYKNIAKYGGDPQRIYIWGQSAGSMALANYLGHSETWGPDGLVVKAAVEMSGGYNLLPLEGKAVNTGPRGPGDGGQAAVAAAAAAPAAPAPAPRPVDPAVQLQRSVLTGFQKLKIPLFVTAAELDPERTVESSHMLNDVMCKAGNCPHYQLSKGESHMSQVMGINSSDTTVSGPIFAWFKSLK